MFHTGLACFCQRLFKPHHKPVLTGASETGFCQILCGTGGKYSIWPRKSGSTLQQSTVPMNFTYACVVFLKWHQLSTEYCWWQIRQRSRARIHRILIVSKHGYQCCQRDWLRDQCMMVSQLHTGHSPLLAAYSTGSSAGTHPPVHTTRLRRRQI